MHLLTSSGIFFVYAAPQELMMDFQETPGSQEASVVVALVDQWQQPALISNMLIMFDN